MGRAVRKIFAVAMLLLTCTSASAEVINISGGVVSITGTSQQVTASSATGAVTLSLPSTLVTPGTLAVTGTEIVSGNGAASISNVLWNGTVFTGGTGTTNFPAMFVQPAGTTPVTTWSISGTGFGTNLASGFSGNFLDFHIAGGTSLFAVASTGGITFGGVTSNAAFTGTGNIALSANTAFTGTTTFSAITASSAITSTNNSINMSGNRTAVAWTTTGRGLVQSGAIWTDTSSSGTIAAEYINAFQAPTLAFSGATTVTNAYNTYFVDPIAGTNATLTNKYAVGTDSLRIAGSAFNAPGLGTSSAATSGTLCWTVTTGLVNVDTTLACLASLEELKNISGPIDGAYALSVENKLKPFWFGWKFGTPEYSGDRHQQPGLGAHATEAVDSRLVAYGTDGKLKGVRYQEIAALHTAAIQELSRKLAALHTENASLRAANDNNVRDIRILKANFNRLERSLHTRQARN